MCRDQVFVHCLVVHDRLGTSAYHYSYKILAGVGVMICLVAVPFCECSRLCTMIMFCTTMSSVGFFYPSICINSLDLTPHYAGLLQAIMYVLSILSERLIGVFASPFPKRVSRTFWTVERLEMRFFLGELRRLEKLFLARTVGASGNGSNICHLEFWGCAKFRQTRLHLCRSGKKSRCANYSAPLCTV